MLHKVPRGPTQKKGFEHTVCILIFQVFYQSVPAVGRLKYLATYIAIVRGILVI